MQRCANLTHSAALLMCTTCPLLQVGPQQFSPCAYLSEEATPNQIADKKEGVCVLGLPFTCGDEHHPVMSTWHWQWYVGKAK